MELNLNILSTCESGDHITVEIPGVKDSKTTIHADELIGELTPEEKRSIAVGYMKLMRKRIGFEEVKEVLSEKIDTEALTIAK